MSTRRFLVSFFVDAPHEAQRRANSVREVLYSRCPVCAGRGMANGAYCDRCDATGKVGSS